MTQAEAQAAFQEDLNRQKQLRDLIRESRERQNRRQQNSDPDNDK